MPAAQPAGTELADSWAPAPSRSAGAERRARQTETLAAVGLLGLVAAATQFLHFRQFGLYEDDYFFIAQAMGQGPDYLAQRLIVFERWTQGRPIGFFLPDLLSWVGDKAGGLTAIYVLGYAIVVLNAVLCYLLLRRRQSQTVALLGGLGFLLFPADTTKILLTHDFQLQPSLTFLLLASIAYLDGRRILPYVLIVGSLISYESPFVVFFGVPLLDQPWTKQTWRALARHVVILLGVLALGILVRVVAGEGRAVGATSGVLEILPRLLGSLAIGPTRALLLFGYGPLRALPTWGLEIAVLALVVGVCLFWVFRRLRPEPVDRRFVELLISGLVLLVLGYVLAFTHYPPTAVAGRSTSVHLAATLGGAIVFAAIASRVLSAGWIGSALVAAYIAVLGGYYLTIQRDFLLAWEQQKTFWTEVVHCCSDVQDGTVLVVETDQPLGTTMISGNSWADPLVPRLLYHFPSDWQNPPRLFTLAPDWTSRIEAAPDGGWQWRVPAATWDEHTEPLPTGNLIVLRYQDGQLVRVDGPLSVDGGSIALKPPAAAAGWPTGPLYPLLVGG
jgi:hypothetical protein